MPPGDCQSPSFLVVIRAHVVSRIEYVCVSPLSHYPAVPLPGVGLLEIEDVPKAAIDLAQQRQWCLAGLFGQICLVERDHRGDVYDRVFG